MSSYTLKYHNVIFQDKRASADMNDPNDKYDDPTPNLNDASNR